MNNNYLNKFKIKTKCIYNYSVDKFDIIFKCIN